MHCAKAECKRGAPPCEPEVVSWCRATRGLERQAEGLGLYPPGGWLRDQVGRRDTREVERSGGREEKRPWGKPLSCLHMGGGGRDQGAASKRDNGLGGEWLRPQRLPGNVVGSQGHILSRTLVDLSLG